MPNPNEIKTHYETLKYMEEAGFKVAIVTNTPHIRAFWFSKAFH